MGSGKYDTQQYYKSASTYVKQERAALFPQKNIHPDFNPVKIKQRESRASSEHPDPTSIIIACDVTGSMGKIPEDLLKNKLGEIMQSFLSINSISNPQVMFAAIGDVEHDKAPLQVTQFESDNRIEQQLKNLYLEGGGGGNGVETYHAIWYFAAYKTQLDSWKVGKKGILFTMGDEMVLPVLKAEHIKKFIDPNYNGSDISTNKLVKEVSEKYDVFHLLVQDTQTYSDHAGPTNDCWRKYLGERAILVPKHTEIPNKIIATVKSLCELKLEVKKPVEAISEETEVKQIDEKLSEAAIMDKLGTFSHKTKPDGSAPVIASSADALSKDLDGVPNMFICPISMTVMTDPVMAEDGFSYDKKSIEAWFKNKKTSPLTNKVIGENLIPNNGLKSEIKQWQEEQQAKASQSTSVATAGK